LFGSNLRRFVGDALAMALMFRMVSDDLFSAHVSSRELRNLAKVGLKVSASKTEWMAVNLGGMLMIANGDGEFEKMPSAKTY